MLVIIYRNGKIYTTKSANYKWVDYSADRFVDYCIDEIDPSCWSAGK